MTTQGDDLRLNLFWYAASTFILLLTATISKLFLAFASKTETQGLDDFVKLLAERENVSERSQGLLTSKLANVKCISWLT